MQAFAIPFIVLLVWEVLASPLQIPLRTQVAPTRPRKLHGRFLQISDLHADPYYAPNTSPSTACHRKKSRKKEKERSGYYGVPFSSCDSPFSLTNFTLDYLGENWASEIDFVIWPGDNARHDNDHKVPRTPAEIYDLNRVMAAKMKEVFLSRGIPVVPSLGNNDIWPHNILERGPNRITVEFSSIWAPFIPFPHLQVFQRGAYYSVEVIPNEVAAISLNTLYFYDSNKAVGGCAFQDGDDPGNLEFDWLEVQLKTYRERNMQVWLTGHVPPSPGNYFPDCYVRYVELSLRFQDTILGHLYGHMNIDHFSFLEAIDLEFTEDDDEISEEQGQDLYRTLLKEYSAIPGDVDLGDYAVVNTAPPVVPNPFLPSFRIYSYNITGDHETTRPKRSREHGHQRGNHGDKEGACKRGTNRATWKCFLNETWYTDPESASRSNRRWTPLGYAQYYLPDVEEGTEVHQPNYELEYLTYAVKALHAPVGVGESDFKYPIPLRHLPEGLRGGEEVKSTKYAPYEMEDLTIGSWVGLARALGRGKDEKLRRRFEFYMYMGSRKRA